MNFWRISEGGRADHIRSKEYNCNFCVFVIKFLQSSRHYFPKEGGRRVRGHSKNLRKFIWSVRGRLPSGEGQRYVTFEEVLQYVLWYVTLEEGRRPFRSRARGWDSLACLLPQDRSLQTTESEGRMVEEVAFIQGKYPFIFGGAHHPTRRKAFDICRLHSENFIGR